MRWCPCLFFLLFSGRRTTSCLSDERRLRRVRRARRVYGCRTFVVRSTSPALVFGCLRFAGSLSNPILDLCSLRKPWEDHTVSKCSSCSTESGSSLSRWPAAIGSGFTENGGAPVFPNDELGSCAIHSPLGSVLFRFLRSVGLRSSWVSDSARSRSMEMFPTSFVLMLLRTSS